MFPDPTGYFDYNPAIYGGDVDPNSFYTPENIARGGYLPWGLDSYASQAGFAVDSPEWNQIYALEQQFRNSPDLYGNPNASFFDFLAQTNPQLAQSIRNPNTEAYDQRQRLLAAQGNQRYDTLLSRRSDSANGGIAPAAAAILGMVGGTAGILGGAAAGAGAAGGGLAPVTTGGASYLPGGVPAVAAQSFGNTTVATPMLGMPNIGPGGMLPNITPVSPSEFPPMPTTGGAPNPTTGGAPNPTQPMGWAEQWLPYITSGINTLLGTHTANQAMDAEAEAMRAAIEEQKRQYDTTRADFEPWMASGRDALNQLNNPAASFQASPDYAFRRDEGTRDIQNTFAARGAVKSGNALKALTEFNSGLASGEFGNWNNRQLARAGLGQTATGSVANAGSMAANQTSNYLSQGGAARSAGLWNRGSIIGGNLTDSVNNWLYRRRTA
jgi:hypothetical protein